MGRYQLIDSVATAGEWHSFHASGFSDLVRGVIFDYGQRPCCGVGLGGLGTGSVDILSTGVLGCSTLFPAPGRPGFSSLPVYRNPQLLLPFLGVSVGESTLVLASADRLMGGRQTGCVEPGMGREHVDDPAWVETWTCNVPEVTGVSVPKNIRYWGHYPIADLEYEVDLPIEIALRAWSPFIPGDLDDSNIPGAVFDVRVRSMLEEPMQISLVLTFPGPLDSDPFTTKVERHPLLTSNVRGVTVQSDAGYEFTLAATSEHSIRTGFGVFGSAWSEIAKALPAASTWDPASWRGSEQADASASIAVDAVLTPGADENFSLILAWHAPGWVGAPIGDIGGFERWDPGPWKTPGRESNTGTTYRSRYALRFQDSRQVVQHLEARGRELLNRVLAWQSVVYTDDSLPDWLPDILVNSLTLLAKNGFWAAPSRDLGSWSAPDGAFGLSESPRGCDVTGCIVSNWYGDFPVLFFFPELERAIMRNYQAYMRPDGAVPFLYPSRDVTRPTYEWLIPLNGPCFIDLVGRLWLRTGDNDVLYDFYPAVKATMEFTIALRGGEDGIVGVHRDGIGQEWWEFTSVRGLVTHAAGIRLASAEIAMRMANAVGDRAFADWCSMQLDAGRSTVENMLWNRDSYLFSFDPEHGETNDDLLTSQLDGDWVTFLHGLPQVFDPVRARRALHTIHEEGLNLFGVTGFVARDRGSDLTTEHVISTATTYGSFTAEMQIVGMTMMYHGLWDEGLEISFRSLDNLYRVQGHAWDLPNMTVPDTGERYFGTDYFQNLSLWVLPAAIRREPLSGLWEEGGLVARILSAAQPRRDADFRVSGGRSLPVE